MADGKVSFPMEKNMLYTWQQSFVLNVFLAQGNWKFSLRNRENMFVALKIMTLELMTSVKSGPLQTEVYWEIQNF